MTSVFAQFGKFALIVSIAVGTCKGETCKDILSSDKTAPSGVYGITVPSKATIEVYCEMGLNGGGYTFLNPGFLSELTAQDLDSMFKDRRSILIRVWKTDGSQPYAVLQQLNEYSHIPLKLALNDHSGHAAPINLQQLGRPYLYVSFLPASIASAMPATNGFNVNGFRNAFKPCDRNPNSQITLFANFREAEFSRYRANGVICDNLISRLASNPSGRIMPQEYFMFAEMHFGGCGCYDDTKRLPHVMGYSIGFR